MGVGWRTLGRNERISEKGTTALQGLIQPELPGDTQGSVFAIFDDKKKLQFIGFSKDLRNSLRTVFSRRPDKAFFFKCALATVLRCRTHTITDHLQHHSCSNTGCLHASSNSFPVCTYMKELSL